MKEVGVKNSRPRKQVAQYYPFLQIVRVVIEVGTLSSQKRSILAKPFARHAKHREVDVAREALIQFVRYEGMFGREDHVTDPLASGDTIVGPTPEPVRAALLIVRRTGYIDNVVAPQRKLHGIGTRNSIV